MILQQCHMPPLFMAYLVYELKILFYKRFPHTIKAHVLQYNVCKYFEYVVPVKNVHTHFTWLNIYIKKQATNELNIFIPFELKQ